MSEHANEGGAPDERRTGPTRGGDATDHRLSASVRPGQESPFGQAEDDSRVYDLVERAREFLRTGHPHQAAMLLSQAKMIEPEKGSIREALARAYYMAGRTARARREFAKAVQIDPVNDYAHFGLGLSCARTGQRTRAIAHLKLAVAMRPGVREYREALERIEG